MTTQLATSSEFLAVFETTQGSDGFYQFLQNIFHIYPEAKFHHLIAEACKKYSDDKSIYNAVQQQLPQITPFLSALTYQLPALKKQKLEMARQTYQALGKRSSINGYLEIGSTGRYVSQFRKDLKFTGPLLLTNDVEPGNGPGDIMERGQFTKLGEFLPLDYHPLDFHGIQHNSLDLVTAYIGLHHAPDELLDGFVQSIHKVLRPGGLLIVRDHDAQTDDQTTFCSLVHTVFNLGLGVSWQDNVNEVRHFASADQWSDYVVERGFTDHGIRLLQDHDPSANTLMVFEKPGKGISA